MCSVPSRRGATPDRDAVQAREHGGLTPAKLTRAFLTRALARGKRAGEIGLGGRPGGDGDRARAVAAGSGLCALESIWEAHLDLGGRLLASDLVHGSVWTAWRPQHQCEKPHGQPGTLDGAVRHANRSRPPREWFRSQRGPRRSAACADVLERRTCRSAARGATPGPPQRCSKLCRHWESPLPRPSVRRHSQFSQAERIWSHPWVRRVHRRHPGSRRRAP